MPKASLWGRHPPRESIGPFPKGSLWGGADHAKGIPLGLTTKIK